MTPSAPNVIFLRLAGQEYLDTLRQYARISPRVAQRFSFAVNDAVQRIAAHPLVGSTYLAPFRWVRVRKFPYLLYYNPSVLGRIIIVAVAHKMRRPGYWLRRVGRS